MLPLKNLIEKSTEIRFPNPHQVFGERFSEVLNLKVNSIA
jgi:hypothetical protein